MTGHDPDAGGTLVTDPLRRAPLEVEIEAIGRMSEASTTPQCVHGLLGDRGGDCDLLAHDDPGWVRSRIDDLTALHERSFDMTWHVADAPAEFIEALQRGIVGVDLVVSRWEAECKLSIVSPSPGERRAPRLATMEPCPTSWSRESRCVAAARSCSTTCRSRHGPAG